MLSQGKQLSLEATELVVRLKRHYDQERKAGKTISTKDPAGRTANGLGIGVATVKRIMADYERSGNKVVVQPAVRPGRPPEPICQNVQPIVRAFIRSENLAGQRVSIDRVRSHLSSEYGVEVPKMTLWRALGRWGFVHGVGRRRDSLKERDYVIRARREYLRVKRANRNADGTVNRPEVYLDETYVNKNHSSSFTWYFDDDGAWVNKPAGVGPRLIVVEAITENGWVNGARLVFEAKKRTGDYHGQMNWENFSKWFESQLMPNISERSLIILDNAKYHNVLVDDYFPKKSSSREELRSWLTHNGYAWREDMLKSELLDACTHFAPKPEYRLDQLAAKHKMTILRTPPYHPELQPIETCWAIVKNHIADHCDFTMAGLRRTLPEAFAKVTPEICQDLIYNKVAEQEDKYWLEDERLDEIFAADAEEDELVHAIHDDSIQPYLAEV
jgi:transposase